MQNNLRSPISFPCGLTMKNKFMLAPMTNTQSFEDGSLSEEEFNWLTMRAKGQFGLVMTCASHVDRLGKGFPGQLGIFSELQNEGHLRLAAKIKSYGSLAVVQLHHAGMRSPKDLIGQRPLCPSENREYGARGIDLDEVEQLKDSFIQAALRAKSCGYDGVEIHGAHGYILCQFMSSKINKRTDKYGGSLENRARILFEIVNGVRKTCGPHFLLGVRLSPEKFGMDIDEVKEICQRLVSSHQIDFLDISLWDVFKYPEKEEYQSVSLLEHFTQLDFQDVQFTVAGKIRNGKDVMTVLDSGVDFVSIGRSAILHHDFPRQVMEDKHFEATKLPVTVDYLQNEGLGGRFIQYMKRWPGFVLE